MFRFFSSLFINLIFCLSVQAQGVGTGFGFASSGNRDSVRWTLSDWLQQKSNSKLQDQWLAMNKQANFFEFGLFGSQQSYDSESGGLTTSETATVFTAQLWVTIFGLEYSHLNSSEDFNRKAYQFNVRLFGQSPTSTNLTAYYGQSDTEFELTNNEFSNDYTGANLRLYIFDFFGLNGSYRKDFEAEDSLGRQLEGDRSAYGAFVEFLIFRVSAEFFNETLDIKPSSGAATQQTRDGLQTSLQIYL